MTKTIVTTTIFPPSEAVKKFATFQGWNVIVVGDKKTPHTLYRNLSNVQYLTPEYQEQTYPELSELIGWNCIQRRNLGYIEAIKNGATVIASVDDDNIPYDGWGSELFLNTPIKCPIYTPTDLKTRVFDPLAVTNHSSLWHRGFPLDKIQGKNDLQMERQTILPDIQADFWNGDPDVDAIERLVFQPTCKFEDKHFPFSGSVLSPFNSQNTFFTPKSLHDFFLFPGVGRMDDIWGSFYCQAKGHKVLYNKATVVQERNPHDYLIDFSKETNGYLQNSTLIDDLLENPESISKYVPESSYRALKLYQSYFHA
jgi:hypothetical protein